MPFVIGPPRSPVIKELIRLQEAERKKERATKPTDTEENAASHATSVSGLSNSGKRVAERAEKKAAPAKKAAAKKVPATKNGRGKK
jgi:hypothetical protein